MTSLRPETALYSNLDMLSINTDLEATAAKLRWYEMELMNELEEAEQMETAERADKEKTDFIEIELRYIWNESDNTIDMGRLKATDLRGNKRITLPPPLKSNKENILQARLALWRSTIEEYKAQHCNSKGEQEQSMDPNLLVGIKKLQRRAARGDVIVTVSNKRNDLVMTSIGIYQKQTEAQTGGDTDIPRSTVRLLKRRVNTALKTFHNTFGTGLAHGPRNRKRIWDAGILLGESSAMIHIATKTHKPIPEDGVPKARAITDVGECTTSQLGNAISILLEACIKSEAWDGECLSTQHQLALLRQANSNLQLYRKNEWSGEQYDILEGGVCLFSGDVEGLFPSLDKEECSIAAGETVARCFNKLVGVNVNHALASLAAANTEEIKKDCIREGIKLPARKHRRGVHPGEFTGELSQMAAGNKPETVIDEE